VVLVGVVDVGIEGDGMFCHPGANVWWVGVEELGG
jgi:hypothetical protein